MNKFVQYRIHCKLKKSLKIPKGGNQNPYIEEEQTTQWPKKDKVQKYKQQSTKLHVQSVPITTNVVSSNPTQARCFRYNIIW
jgi:hypothetical protein